MLLFSQYFLMGVGGITLAALGLVFYKTRGTVDQEELLRKQHLERSGM